MKIEDLEKALQYFVIAVPESEEQAKAYFWARKAITALRSMQEAGEPLSLEQLREVPHGKIKDSTLQNIANRANEIASPPAHIDRREWISVKERLPDDEKDGETVLAIVSGKPHKNIMLCHALMTAGYFYQGGWLVDEYPEWENPTITHWIPLPEPPEEG